MATGRLFVVALVAVMFASSPARAVDVALNAGAVEVVAIPQTQHLGFYPYAGISLTEAFTHVALVPSLVIEFAPENGHWGFVGALVVDFPVTKRIGLDIDAVILHDQPGFDFAKAELLVGGGVGFSIYLGRWTVSPYVNVLYDLVVAGQVVVPGLNVAFTL